MSGRGQSQLSRGGPRSASQGPVQYLPAENSEYQYEGMLRGVGVSSKEPICSKRSNSLAKLHMATHFAIGCKKWDEEGARGVSMSHNAFADPEVVYATRDAPDKNASVVELRQREHIPEVHYRTEQSERFEHPGVQELQLPFPLGKSKVHFGDDTPDLVTTSHNAHCRQSDLEDSRGSSFKTAGLGVLVPNTVWHKPPRVHPVTAGPRSLENHDYGVAAGMRFGRISGNRSAIVMEHHVRNPVLGHHIPIEAYKVPHARTTQEIVEDHNREVPHLRSLGALRPHPQ
mmetsp:Transcript_82308/g.129615  ORF Transcript_82308/g.129615 Transcript_82308/m.129615 type:complete len:286 (-) Transcript_82308:84-941(-)